MRKPVENRKICGRAPASALIEPTTRPPPEEGCVQYDPACCKPTTPGPPLFVFSRELVFFRENTWSPILANRSILKKRFKKFKNFLHSPPDLLARSPASGNPKNLFCASAPESLCGLANDKQSSAPFRTRRQPNVSKKPPGPESACISRRDVIYLVSHGRRRIFHPAVVFRFLLDPDPPLHRPGSNIVSSTQHLSLPKRPAVVCCLAHRARTCSTPPPTSALDYPARCTVLARFH